jgi:thiamine-phosphate diphosphorylase
MILCLVSDRRRLGAAIGAPPAGWIDALYEQVAAAGRAGIDIVQVREPDIEAGQLTLVVRALMRTLEGTPTKLLVNDRVDVAIAAGASGVHLKEQSMLPADVRRIAPHLVIGCSVHGTAASAARKSADLLIAGTVMPTASKPAVDYLDLDGLEAIVAAAAGQPVLGIGGLDVQSAAAVAATGAAGLAAIGAFIPAAGEEISEFVQKRVSALRLAFDSRTPRT